MQIRGFYSVELRDRFGSLIKKEEATNHIFRDGRVLVMDLAFRKADTSFFVGLLSDGLVSEPSDNAILSDLVTQYEPVIATEPGYDTRLLLSRGSTDWPVLGENADGFAQISSKKVAFTATDNWARPMRWIFLTTDGAPGATTGKLISVAQLSEDFELHNGDSLSVTYTLQLGEV